MTRKFPSNRAREESCWRRPRSARGTGSVDAAAELDELAGLLRKLEARDLIEIVMSDDLQQMLDRFPDRSMSTSSPPLRVIVEREQPELGGAA